MEKNSFVAEIVLRKTNDGRIICNCEGSLADQKDLLGYYISKIAKALGLDEVEDLVDDIGFAAGEYLEALDGENCVYKVSEVEPDKKSQSDETPTDCEHCRNEGSCLYKDIYSNGCSQFVSKE